VQKRTETYPAAGGHPLKDFFEPTEQTPAKWFGHVVDDGFVIVHYNPQGQVRRGVDEPLEGGRGAGAVESYQREHGVAVCGPD
jgi:hypothetical protein